MALLLGYGLVTFPEMLLQGPAGRCRRCTIFPAFHPAVSVMVRVNAVTWCASRALQTATAQPHFGLSSISLSIYLDI